MALGIDPEQPTVLLDAVTATGAGATYANAQRRIGGPFSHFTWQLTTTGTPTGISATLEASLDGSLWSVADTSTNVAGEARQLANWPATFFRANLGTLTGGTSPTVTVTIQPGG